MKNIIKLAALVALLYPWNWAHAYSWGDLRDEFESHTKLSLLKSASPVYLYNMRKGRSEGGIETNVLWYRFLSADIGWANPYDAGKRGTILGGGSVHIDKMIAEAFPTFSDFGKAFVPDSAWNFWDKLFVGFYFGRNIDEKQLDYGIKSGLEVRF